MLNRNVIIGSNPKRCALFQLLLCCIAISSCEVRDRRCCSMPSVINSRPLRRSTSGVWWWGLNSCETYRLNHFLSTRFITISLASASPV